MNWFKRFLRLDGVKDIEPWRGGASSTENSNNFITNQVTLADYRDSRMGAQSAAIGLSATWACVQLIAGTIASLPLMVYRTENGIRKVAKDHPLYFVLHDSPNYDQTAVDFWEVIAASIELHGNAYALIERRSSDGAVNALHPVRPDIVKARRRDNGEIEYEWVENGRRYVKPGGDMLHIRGPLGDGLSGSSTLATCMRVFDGALSAESAASAMFQNGVNPSGILSTKPEVQLTPQQRREMEQHLATKYMGSVRQGRPMLLDNGLTWTQLTINPQDAQMLESRKFSGEEVCRIFGVPPAMAGYGDKASNWGTGKEVDVIGFQKFTLRKRLKRIEQGVLKQLVSLPERRSQGIVIEFNLEGLLRGDTASRYDAYERAIRMGLATRNECRALENLPPIDGGDVITVQMQDIPLSSAINGGPNGQENGSGS